MMDSSVRNIPQYARTMAKLHFELHQIVASDPSSQKERLRGIISHPKSQLSATTLAKVLSNLDGLPEGQVICHGDFHPDNILITGTGDSMIIDWADASVGHPAADVARTILLLNSPIVPISMGIITRVALKIIRPWIRNIYIREYQRLSGISMSEINSWMLPIAAARLSENIAGEKEWLLGLICKERY